MEEAYKMISLARLHVPYLAQPYEVTVGDCFKLQKVMLVVAMPIDTKVATLSICDRDPCGNEDRLPFDFPSPAHTCGKVNNILDLVYDVAAEMDVERVGVERELLVDILVQDNDFVRIVSQDSSGAQEMNELRLLASDVIDTWILLGIFEDMDDGKVTVRQNIYALDTG